MAKRIIKPDSGNTLVLQEDNGSIDALTVETNGNITLAEKLIIDPAKGIQFRTTTGGSGTLTSGILDDYEEGTWTPTAVSGVTSFTLQTARYVKVGNIVTVSIYIGSLSGLSSGALQISGLPFNVLNNHYFTGYFDSSSSGKMGMLRTINNSNDFNAYYPNTSTALRTNFLGTDLGSHLMSSFTYMAS